MSAIDNPNFVRFVRAERNKRVQRNSSKPIHIPDSGIIPNFPPSLNKARTPQSIDGLGKFTATQRRRNQGAKPQGAQRFPMSVPKLGGYVKISSQIRPKGNSIRNGYVEHSRMRE